MVDDHIFYVKREDLSSPIYGGNKVRTLQHQLAVIESRLSRATSDAETARLQNVIVVGTGGSNQVVATAVHARQLHLTPLHVAWVDKDLPDLDNSLNMLSALSFPLLSASTWGRPLPMVAHIIKTLATGSGIVLPLGGNNPAGVLGQVGGMLELAEQISAGEVPDPRRVVLPVGSACTVSGLIIGVALCRRLKLDAFQHREFKIIAVPIHHVFALLARTTNFHKAAFARFMPLTMRHTIEVTTKALHNLGGPDLREDALRILADEVEIEARADLVGKYGGHSEMSKARAEHFDASAVLTDAAGAPVPKPWMCGHFCAKALAALMEEAERSPNAGPLLLWQTKSAVQPRGEVDEWEKMVHMPMAVREWADLGQAQSKLRPGSVDTRQGAAADYRHLTTLVGDSFEDRDGKQELR